MTREVFASHADQVIVSRIRSDHGSLGVSFRISIRGENGPFMRRKDTIEFQGQALEGIHSNGSAGVMPRPVGS